MERGTVLYYAGDYAAALEALRAYMDDAPSIKLPDTHYYSGLCYSKQGAWQRAFAEFDTVIERYPDHALVPDAWAAKARAEEASGGDPSGIYLEFAVRYPSNTRAAEFVWLAAQALEGAGNWSEAARLYRRLRSDYPTSTRNRR